MGSEQIGSGLNRFNRTHFTIMLEPVTSGIVSILLDQKELGANFLRGALFIGISNVPSGFLVFCAATSFHPLNFIKTGLS